MSYADVAAMFVDHDLRQRLTACAAIEGDPQPEIFVQSNLWALVASPGWADAYGYAVDLGKEHPGKDESVITDTMILSAVQARRAAIAEDQITLTIESVPEDEPVVVMGDVPPEYL